MTCDCHGRITADCPHHGPLLDRWERETALMESNDPRRMFDVWLKTEGLT